MQPILPPDRASDESAGQELSGGIGGCQRIPVEGLVGAFLNREPQYGSERDAKSGKNKQHAPGGPSEGQRHDEEAA